MAAVKNGGDRQELHEKIRGRAMEATMQINEGRENRLLDALRRYSEFRFSLFLQFYCKKTAPLSAK